MPSQYSEQELRVNCTGGLYTLEDTLTMSSDFPGAAERLINYEVSPRGGYRRIEGFDVYDTSSDALPGTGATLGVAIFDDSVYGARAVSGAANYEIRKWETGTGWATTATNSDTRSATGVDRVRVRRHNFAGQDSITFTDGVNFPARLDADGTWSVISGATASSDVYGAKYARDFKNHMAYAGMPGVKSNFIVFSAPNTSQDFHAGHGSVTVNVGFSIQGVGVFRDSLYIFGTDEIKKITGNNSADFQLVDVTKNIGTVSGDTILEIGGDVVYWSSDGVRLISGTDRIGDVNLETISENIKPTIINYPDLYDLTNVIGVVIRDKTQFRYFIYDSTQATSEALGLVGAKRYFAGGRGSQWEFGDLLGIQVNCADSSFIGGKEVIIHGGPDGKVYRQENGATSFAGEQITSVYQTPYIDAGSTEVDKDWRRVHLFYRSEGEVTLKVGFGLAWDDPDYHVPTNRTVSIQKGTTTYDDFSVKYDSANAVWDGSGRRSVRLNVGLGAPSMRFSLVGNSTTDKPHTIQGFVLRYILNGPNT